MEDKECQLFIPVDDFDTSLLPPHARTPGTDAFNTEVTKHLQQEYSVFGGQTRIIVSDKLIHISWRQGDSDPFSQALEHLTSGDYSSGIRMLRSLIRQFPSDIDVLYNLGLALSETGEFEEAESVLERAVAVEPTHANSFVGLGVAQQRQKRTTDAIESFRQAVALDGKNPWAHRNLGACLLSAGDAAAGLEHLERATELNPDDQQAWSGLGQAHEQIDDSAAADECYRRVIDLDPDSPVGALAKQRRSQIGQAMKGGGVRPDAVAHCIAALEKFSAMSSEEIQLCSFEIAMRRQSGLDFNDPTPKYEFKTLEGSFSGIQALAYMYVGFKYVMPGTDIGFDLLKEYEMAKSMLSDDAP